VRSEIAQRLAEGETPFAVARALGIDRKTVLKYAGHASHHAHHQHKVELAAR
jgi:DNA-binding CsgD family transcriptional regulator